MRERIEFVLEFEDGRTRTFTSMTDAIGYAYTLADILRPRSLTKLTTTVRTETVREWKERA